MAKIFDTITLPVTVDGETTPEQYLNNPKSTAPQFSASKAYAAGEYVYYNNKLYCFTAAHAAGAWTGSDAEEITVSGELTAIKADLTELETDLKSAIKNGTYPFDLIAGSYVTTNGIITLFNDWSRTDYIPCDGYTELIAYRTLGNGSIYNCFYDDSKSFVSSFSTGALNERKVITIPKNAKYVILSDTTQFMDALTIAFNPTVEQKISNIETVLNDIAEKDSTTVTPANSEKYAETGYIRSNDGALVAHAFYQCYTFTMSKTADVWFDSPQGWNQIAVYNGNAFDTAKMITVKTSSANNLPTQENPLSITEGYTVAVCVSVNESFTLYIGTGPYIAKVKQKPKVIIRPQYATSFMVDVLDEKSGEYIRYWFYHSTFTDTVEYGNGQTKTLVTYDVWLNNNINDENGNLIFQGNTNFIHALSEEGHIGHVGAGHGCTVMDCSQFFANGKPFNPATLANDIECTSFRFVIKAKHYKIDDSITTSASHAMPALDSNGNPIVTSEWVFDGTWTVNNRIEMTNHLEILQNNLTFRQCHAGMLCGFYPNIYNAMMNGRKGLFWNSTNGTQCIDESDSGVTFNAGVTTSLIADSATIFGLNYVAKQDIEQFNPVMYGKENVLAWMPPNGDNRLKMYMMPCVCTESTALIDEGKTVDVFNVGDSIDVKMVRTIKIAP